MQFQGALQCPEYALHFDGVIANFNEYQYLLFQKDPIYRLLRYISYLICHPYLNDMLYKSRYAQTYVTNHPISLLLHTEGDNKIKCKYTMYP